MTSERAHSFGGNAAAYHSARPTYPAEAVAWLTGPSPRRVLDLGAGTGILTDRLLAAGHQVIAVDPSVEMLAVLSERQPDVTTAVGTAHQIPLPSRSVDVIACGQSFHWFSDEPALAEMARVLRPGGHLALVWNARDERAPWVRKLNAIIGTNDGSAPGLADPLYTSEHFEDPEVAEFRHWHDLDREKLLGLIRSRSEWLTADESRQQSLLERVGALYDEYDRGTAGMQLPFLARCFRAEVRHHASSPEPPGEVDRALHIAAPETDDDPGITLIDWSKP